MCYLHYFHFWVICEFLKLWMANHGFGEFPNLIKYYTTIGNGTLLKEEYTTTNNHTLHKDKKFKYLTKLNFSEDTPNQILQMFSTLILWSKLLHSYWSISYPIQFLSHHRDKLILWEYHPDNPSTCVKLKIF